ncbi:MAG: TonB-dependent receptor [Acidobacteria bacterium]|nr:TonB-dependent receptor [Acidobacteriota bacterium]
MRILSQSNFLRNLVCSFLFFFATAGILAAQNTGTILGTIKDQSGAVLPGAEVIAKNVETGSSRSIVSGSRGEYRIPALAVGTYEVQATMAGFQTGVRQGIALNLGREAVVDFSLQVGAVTEQVTVTEEAPLINTTSATVSGLVDPKQMRDIPLNARSFIELVPLQAGAVFADSGEQSATKGFGKKLAIVGTRYNTNSFLLDGADINDVAGSSGSAAGTMAGVETVREFRVITNAYDAEYGRHTGGVISAITKSGTNEFHGSVFEFLRNDNLDAARWEDNAFNNGKKPEFKRNQFGGSLGGPILHDRTFFFGSYEGLRQNLGRTRTFNVPGIAAREGQRVPIDAVMKPYVEVYPLPNIVQPNGTLDRSDGTGRFVKTATQPTNQNYGNVRVDHKISDSDSIFGRFNIDSADSFDPALNTGVVSKTANRFATIEETHIFSPNLLNRTHLSFNRTRIDLFDVYLDNVTPMPRFNFSDDPTTPGQLSVTSLTALGGGSTNPKDYVQNVWQFKEDFFWTRGQHSFKFGGQFERFQFNMIHSAFYLPGQFSFTSLNDFLTRQVDNAHFIRPGSDDIRGFRENLLGLYLQDDISVRPGLTLNMGVRYEIISSPTEVNGKLATVRDLRPEHFYAINSEQTDTGEPYFLNPSLKNFAPRVGFAWTPFKSGKTAIRWGIGAYHDQLLPTYYQVAGVRVPPYFTVAEMFRASLARLSPPQTIDFPNAFFSQRTLLVQNIGSQPQLDGFQFKVSQPAVYKWSLDIQQQLSTDTTLEAGYAGTRGTHLVRGALNLNATPATKIDGRRFFLIDQPTLNPYLGRMRWRITDGTSDYHGLRMSLSKRFSRGFQVQSSYTFSKSIDDSSTWTGGTDWNDADRSAYLGEKEHGLSSFDVRHSFFTNFVYELPGRQLTGPAGKALGGWSLSGILRINGGNPIDPTADQPRLSRGGQTYSLLYADGSNLDLIPGGNTNPVRPQNPNQYFDVTQFSYPATCLTANCNPPGAFQGNLGRNTLITPGVANLDLTLTKNTQFPWFGESGGVEFRAEFFNVFNRPNFGIPALSVFDRSGVLKPDAGQITTTRTNSRQMQLALRIVF